MPGVCLVKLCYNHGQFSQKPSPWRGMVHNTQAQKGTCHFFDCRNANVKLSAKPEKLRVKSCPQNFGDASRATWSWSRTTFQVALLLSDSLYSVICFCHWSAARTTLSTTPQLTQFQSTFSLRTLAPRTMMLSLLCVIQPVIHYAGDSRKGQLVSL